MSVDPKRLDTHFIHLGLGATAVAQPPFSGMEWYEEYGQRHGGDGREGRLVSMYSFSESWDSWERHPVGEEVVICTEGCITLHQEFPDGRTAQVTLNPGEYAINPAGVWHTADVEAAATAVFITAGEGTDHRPR
ncbi:cupin [Altererythrobacter sp. MF3-039]|uniref:cupin n=1 Tax=Altererythrobacter sp. MF3-039 TaxID=3252901 RepID=UPI00390C413C